MIVYFMAAVAPPGEAREGVALRPALSLVLEPARYAQIGQALVVQTAWLGNVLWLVLGAAWWLLGAAAEPWQKPALRTGGWTLALLLSGYLAVYLISAELGWLLRTTMSRLLVQLWPSALFLIFLSMNTPGTARRPLSR